MTSDEVERAVWWRDSYMEGAREERWFVAVFSDALAKAEAF